MTVATIVDWEALLDAALASVAAGLVVTIAASATIWGAASSAEARRDGRGGAAIAAAGVAILGALAFAAAIVLGLIVMIQG